MTIRSDLKAAVDRAMGVDSVTVPVGALVSILEKHPPNNTLTLLTNALADHVARRPSSDLRQKGANSERVYWYVMDEWLAQRDALIRLISVMVTRELLDEFEDAELYPELEKP